MILAALLAAASFQDIAGLDRAVSAFTGHGIGQEGGARTGIDARLRLAQCPTVSMAWRTEAHDAVVVTCTGPDWRLFVPVRAAVSAPVAVPVRASYVAPVKVPPVIRRGDPVVIEAGTAGFSISREGVALADATPGARFLVRIEDARAPVQAIAVDSGRAQLPGWGM